MSKKSQRMFLRSKKDGYLLGYDAKLAQHPDMEVCTEEEAYPERHMPKHVEKKAKEAEEAKEPEAPIDLAAGITEVEKPAPTDPALAKTASKGLPK